MAEYVFTARISIDEVNGKLQMTPERVDGWLANLLTRGLTDDLPFDVEETSCKPAVAA